MEKLISASESSHDFDSVAVDSTVEWELVIENTSHLTREISSIEVESEVFSCKIEESFSLRGNADTSFTVYFHPRADSIYTASLVVHSGERSLEIPLSGRGYTPSGIEASECLPLEFALKAAYPNPFNSSTSIRYSIPQAGLVRLSIYDLSGREIAQLVEGMVFVGTHEVTFNARSWPSGLYLVQLESGGQTALRKLTLIK